MSRAMTVPSAPTLSGSSRYLPLSGVLYSALTVLGAVAFPMPPGGDVSPAGAPEWLAAHTGPVIAQSYVRALAAVAFIAFSAVVATACRRALPARSSLPSLALAGGALCGGLLLLAQAAVLASTLYARGGGAASTVRAMGDIGEGMLDMSSLPAVLLFAAVGLTAVRTGLLPRWLAVVTLLGVPFALVDAGSYDGGPLASVGFAGLVYFLVWTLVTGGQLCVRRTLVEAPELSASVSTH